MLIQTPHVDRNDQRGSSEHLRRQLDFARSPLRDHQQFLLVDHCGELRYHSPGGMFKVLRSDLWLDLSVGHFPKSQAPIIVYRIDRNFYDPAVSHSLAK